MNSRRWRTVQLPISRNGLPPAKFRTAESLVLTAIPRGSIGSRKNAGELATAERRNHVVEGADAITMSPNDEADPRGEGKTVSAQTVVEQSLSDRRNPTVSPGVSCKPCAASPLASGWENS